MDAIPTIVTGLSMLSSPALVMVCLAHAAARGGQRTQLAVAAYPLALVTGISAIAAAQHSHGWGLVGHIATLLTTAACVLHLLELKLKKGRRTKRRTTSKAKGSKMQVKNPASQAVLEWGRQFIGTHAPWAGYRGQPRRTPDEVRQQILAAMADEARQLGREDVLADGLQEVDEALGKRR